MIGANGGKAAVASYPNAVGPNGVRSRPGLKPAGRQACSIRYHCFRDSYLIRELLGYPDLALKGEVTFGVSAAQKYNIDIDRTHAALSIDLMPLARTPIEEYPALPTVEQQNS